MKKLSIQISCILLISTLLLAACGAAVPAAPPGEQESSANQAPASSKGKIAAVLTGPPDDNSWNEAAFNALEALKKDGYETAYSESIADADAARVLREYADKGFQVVVAHSFGYQDATFQVAKEHPEVNLAWAGGINKTAKNVADYDQPFYEPAYLVGIVAGHVSKSGKLGAIYGFDIPVCHAMGEAALAGAKTVNPNAELTVTAVGDWIDVAKAKEAALAQADAGVDFWIECGEGPALGTIEAAKERQGFVTGYVGDMTENGPDVVLVNIVWNLEPLFKKMLDETAQGKFNAPFYQDGIAAGVLDVTINPKLADKIPQEAMTQVEQAKKDIVSSALKVPYVPQ